MKTTRKLIEFILIHCILYHFIQQYHVTDARCSWGSWLPWNCSCCGGSVDKEVYRIKNKCCDHTYECANLRSVAQNITDVNKFEERGSCFNDCGNKFSNHNPHPCTSSKMHLDEVTEQNRIKSCNDACIGTLTTTTTTLAAKPTATKVTSETTLHNASSQTTKIFRGGENGTITTENGQSLTSSFQTGSSIKDTTIFPGDATEHVSKRMPSANASFAYPSSSKFQTGNTVSSEKNTPSNGVWSSTTPVTTPTSPSTSSVTNRKTTSTRVPHSRASGKTLTTIYSTAEGSSKVSYESSSNVKNVVDPDDINYGVTIGVPVAVVILILLILAGTLSTTRTTTTTFAAVSTTTKVTRKPTVYNVSSQTTQTLLGGRNGTTSFTTRNGQHKTSITSSLQTGSSVKDTTIFPGDVTVHVSKRMTSAKASVIYPSSLNFQTASSENNHFMVEGQLV